MRCACVVPRTSGSTTTDSPYSRAICATAVPMGVPSGILTSSSRRCGADANAGPDTSGGSDGRSGVDVCAAAAEDAIGERGAGFVAFVGSTRTEVCISGVRAAVAQPASETVASHATVAVLNQHERLLQLPDISSPLATATGSATPSGFSANALRERLSYMPETIS